MAKVTGDGLKLPEMGYSNRRWAKVSRDGRKLPEMGLLPLQSRDKDQVMPFPPIRRWIEDRERGQIAVVFCIGYLYVFTKGERIPKS